MKSSATRRFADGEQPECLRRPVFERETQQRLLISGRRIPPETIRHALPSCQRLFGVIGTFWLRTQSRRGEIGAAGGIGGNAGIHPPLYVLEGLRLLMLTVVPVLVYAFNMMYLDRLDSYRIPLGVGVS